MSNVNTIVTAINKELKTNLVVGDDEALDTIRISTGMPNIFQRSPKYSQGFLENS